MALAEVAMNYPICFIIVLAGLITTVTTLVQKHFTDQEHLKALKKRQKEIQAEIKKTKEPTLMQELNAEMLQLTGLMFKKSMKPMFVTMIPLLFIIGWAHANIAYDPITPDEEFFIKASFDEDTFGLAEIIVPEGVNVIGNSTKEVDDGEVKWILSGDAGKYDVEVLFSDEKAVKEFVISEGAEYEKAEKTYGGKIEAILIGNEKRIYVNLLGWKLGWLGSYILLSVLFSMGLRKVLKVA